MNENLKVILESMDELGGDIDSMVADDNVMDNSIDRDEDSNDRLIDELDKIYTPVLINQSISNGTSDMDQQYEMSKAGVLTERNIIKFDDSSILQQLYSTCALLTKKDKKDPKYDMFKKLTDMRKKVKLDIQAEEKASSKALAQQYLLKLSTTSNSNVVRNAASRLLPETQK